MHSEIVAVSIMCLVTGHMNSNVASGRIETGVIGGQQKGAVKTQSFDTSV